MDAPTEAPKTGVTEATSGCLLGSSLLLSLGLSVSRSLSSSLPLHEEEEQDKEDNDHDRLLSTRQNCLTV